MRADVQVRDRASAASCRVERESARKAKGIKDIASGREGLDPAAVLALVEEKPGLLATGHIRLETQSGFEEHDWAGESWAEQHLPVRPAKPRQRDLLDVAAQAQNEPLRAGSRSRKRAQTSSSRGSHAAV